jgi:excisionase family DNA binding protein
LAIIVAAPIPVSHRKVKAATLQKEMVTQPKLPLSFSVTEVAEILRVNSATVYRLVRRRDLPGLKIGGKWRFNRTELEKWLQTSPTLDAPAGTEARSAVPLRQQ